MESYPTAAKIEEIFADRDIPEVFDQYLADNVDLTVVGKELHLGGNNKSKKAFHDAVYSRMTDSVVRAETINLEVLSVIGRGDSPWAAVESVATATTKSGQSICLDLRIARLLLLVVP